MKTRLLATLLCLSLPGCFRTVYRNIQPPNSPAPVEDAKSLNQWKNRSWQHFFAYGLIPSEVDIDAAKICGGDAHVQTLETRRTFLESLVSVYGIYTPWNAHVTCDHTVVH